MISDNINCMDLMEPEVVYKMDSAIIGEKSKNIKKLRDGDSLKTDANI